MALSHSPSIVTDGLVLCLDAANLKSYPGTGTGWNDLSNTGNNGVLTNGPTYSLIKNGTIVFDGVNDYVTFSNTTIGSFPNANFSYGAWFYYTGISQGGIIMAKRNDSPYNQYSLAIFNDATNGGNGTKLAVFMNPDTGGGSGVWTSFNYELGTTANWYNAVVTNTGTQQKVYVNGVSVMTENKTQSSFSITGCTLYIGAANLDANPGNFFKSSYISSAFLYNRVLSDSEISQNFNALRGRFGI